MESQPLFDSYIEALLGADRHGARNVVRKALGMGTKAQAVYQLLLWPGMEKIGELFRQDRISIAGEHLATRINRFLADQVQGQLIHRESRGQKALIICAAGEPEELGTQMTSDLLEADGWETYFVGGGVPEDEIVELVGAIRPDLMVICGTTPVGTPGTRQMIDRIRDIGACPMMNIMVIGGIFNRVEGLWEEINADLWATTAMAAVELAGRAEKKMHLPRVPGAPNKRRRRLAAAASDNQGAEIAAPADPAYLLS